MRRAASRVPTPDKSAPLLREAKSDSQSVFGFFAALKVKTRQGRDGRPPCPRLDFPSEMMRQISASISGRLNVSTSKSAERFVAPSYVRRPIAASSCAGVSYRAANSARSAPYIRLCFWSDKSARTALTKRRSAARSFSMREREVSQITAID